VIFTEHATVDMLTLAQSDQVERHALETRNGQQKFAVRLQEGGRLLHSALSRGATHALRSSTEYVTRRHDDCLDL
jgi:hypothetical protein